MTYEIILFEYNENTGETETYIVLVNGRDGPVFVTIAEAEEWVASR